MDNTFMRHKDTFVYQNQAMAMRKDNCTMYAQSEVSAVSEGGG